MNTAWGADISNWDGPLTSAMASCWKNQGMGVLTIRASLESSALISTGVQQSQVAIAAGLPTMHYCWAYGSDDPATMLQTTVNTYGKYNTTSRYWLDIEDVTNFTARSSPRRHSAIDMTKVTFATLTPIAAVTWLLKAFAAAKTLGIKLGIYSASWAWNPLTGTSTVFATNDWWVADGDGNDDLTVFLPVGGVSQPVGKQYLISSQGVTLCGSATLDFSIFNADMIFPPQIVQPVPPIGIDVTDAQSRLNTLDQMLDTQTETNHTWIDGIRQDLNAQTISSTRPS